jgi:hypothetical protein
MQRLVRPPARDVGLEGPAIQAEDLRRDEGLEGSAGAALAGHRPARDSVDLRRPVVLETQDEAPSMRFTSPEPRPAGVPTGGQEATAPPGRVAGHRPAVRLPSGAARVAHRRAAADREDVMHVDRRSVASPRTGIQQGLANRYGRGIHDGPVLHSTQRSRQIARRRLSSPQGAFGQRRHTRFEGCVEPPLARCPCDLWHCKLQGGTPDVGWLGAAWRPRRHDPRPHQQPEVPLARPLDHPARLAQAFELLLRPHRLEDLAHLVTWHGPAPPRCASMSGSPDALPEGEESMRRGTSQAAQDRDDRGPSLK